MKRAIKNKRRAMNSIRAYRWFYLPAAFFLVSGVFVALSMPYGDEIIAFNPLRHEPWNHIFEFFSFCGEPWPWLIAMVTLLLRKKYRFAALIVLAALAILPLAYVLKDQFGIDRPATYFEKTGEMQEVITVPGVRLHLGQTSFPSGHTMSAFSLYSLLALMTGGKKRQRYGLLCLALLAMLVGISRMFLVQHFMTDVLGGAALGLAVGGLVWRLNGRLMHYFPQ